MKRLILPYFLLIGFLVQGQTFLEDYKAFETRKIKSDKILDSLRKSKSNETLKLTRKIIREGKKGSLLQLEKQLQQFDTVFKAYKQKTGFDFNKADSLLIVYQTDIQSALRKFIIISGKDSITYGEKWKMIGLHSSERRVVYEPFLDTSKSRGLIHIDDRDSLLILASRKDFNTAHKLAKENPCDDGSTSTIIIAIKTKGNYQFDYCFLTPFMIAPIWRKE